MLKPGKTIVRLELFLLIIVTLTISSVHAQSTPDSALHLYFDALKSGDFSKASTYWDVDFIAASNRLGITYSDSPVKFDCASPIVRNLDKITEGTAEISINGIEQNGNNAKIQVSVTSGGDTLDYDYYAIRGNNQKWQLTSSAYIHCQKWEVKDTRYVRIFYNDSSRINQFACDAIDKFIDSVGARLKISSLRMSQLSDNKLHYYLCDEDDMIAITGFNARGMGDLALDAVISREFPHEHELVHILINFALENNSLYTLPFMQEGLACDMGGRWGRAPAIIKYTGFVNLHFGIAQLEDILTYDDFYGKIGSAETSYPVSAVFVNYLKRICQPERFLRLYRQLSGTDREIQSMTRAHIISIIEEISGRSWISIIEDFNDFWPRFEFCGIKPFLFNTPADSTIVYISNAIRLSSWKLNFDYLHEIDFSNSPDGCVITLLDKQNLPGENYQSRQFYEHLPIERYSGQRYGLKVTASEVGLYDYFYNRLIASYVMGFDMNSGNQNIKPGITRILMSNNLLAPYDLTDFEIEIISL